MFEATQNATHRFPWSKAVSFAGHCAIVYLLVRPPAPIFVTPSSVMRGDRGTSTEIVYLGRTGAETTRPTGASDVPKRISLPIRRPSKHARTPERPISPLKNVKGGDELARAPRAGSPWGTLLTGPVDGHEMRPALPFVFPDPDVPKWSIPSGVNGTVIVEITIDAQGNVVATKVLQALGHGIEEKVIAALRNWRFRPATLDGVAMPSQQDVYFHFPS